MELTPKERFKLTVEHRDVDRPVVDFQAAPEDVRSITPEYIGPPLREFPDGSKEDIFGVRRKELDTPSGKTRVEVYFPIKEIKTIDDFRKNYSFPPYEYFDFEIIKEKVKKNKKYVLNAGWMTIWYLYFFLRGMEQALIDMILNKEFFHYVMKAIADW